jgi:hypothetical protein
VSEKRADPDQIKAIRFEPDPLGILEGGKRCRPEGRGTKVYCVPQQVADSDVSLRERDLQVP